MHPRVAAAVVIAISAFLLATAVARTGRAQTASNRAIWTMPASVSTSAYAPSSTATASAIPAYASAAPAYATAAPAYTSAAPAYTPAPAHPSGVPANAYGPAPAYTARQAVDTRVAVASRVTMAQPETPASRNETPTPEKRKPRDYHFDLGVGTEVPISVGGVLTAELPHRFLLQLGVGVLPTAYSNAIDGFLTSVGAYDAVVSQAVRGSLGNSAVVRASIGGRPFEGHGFEILGGYTLITGGGSVATTDVLAAIVAESGASFQVPAGLSADIPISATLHNFHASLGWRWLLADDRFVIRASLSYIQTVGSRIDVKIPASATVLTPYQGQINEQVNAYLGPYFSKYAKAPTLGLSAAVRF